MHCELLSEAEVKQLLIQRKKNEANLVKREVEKEMIRCLR